MALYLRYAVRSDLGLVRNNNEDSVYAGPRLLAIADGMGGHAAGEVASKIVISTLEHLDEDRRIDDLTAELRDTVVHANHRIADAVDQRKELEGMGTTLTALRFVGSQVGLVHVGDSRAYLMRAGELTQITRDDTYVQYLVEEGKLTPEEAKDHPRKSVILKALLGSDVDPSVSIREALPGDRYLLCSDGLSDVVSAETIADTLQIEDPQEAADRLVELALRGGGPDNVTVIVADAINLRPGDHVDDVPVIAGAFVDPAAADVPDVDGADSPAERAARMSRPAAGQRPAETPEQPPQRRHRWRGWLFGVAAVIVVAAVLGGIYAWTQTQYFVSRAGNRVAVFQGVNTALGPLKLYSVDHRTDVSVSGLCSTDRIKVNDGITASGRGDADAIVARLVRDRVQSCPTQRPPCPPSSSASTVPSGTSSTTAGLSTSPSPGASRPTSPSGARGSSAGTGAAASGRGANAGGTALGNGLRGAASTSTTPPASTSTSTSTGTSGYPGCR